MIPCKTLGSSLHLSLALCRAARGAREAASAAAAAAAAAAAFTRTATFAAAAGQPGPSLRLEAQQQQQQPPPAMRLCLGGSVGGIICDSLAARPPGEDTAPLPPSPPPPPPPLGAAARVVAAFSETAAPQDGNEGQQPPGEPGAQQALLQLVARQDVDGLLQALATQRARRPRGAAAAAAAAPAMAPLPPGRLLELLVAAGGLASPSAGLLSLLTHATVQALPQLAPRQLAEALRSLADAYRRLPGQQPTARPEGRGDAGEHLAAAPLSEQQQQQQQQQQAEQQHQQQQQHQQEEQHQHQQQQQLATARRSLNRAVAAYLKQQPRAFDAASTASVAAALAALGAPQERGHQHQQHAASGPLTLLAVLASEHVPHMDPGQLADLLEAFVATGHYNAAVVDAAAAAAVVALRRSTLRLQPEQHEQQQQQQRQQRQQQQAAAAAGEADSGGGAAAFTAPALARLLRAAARLRHHDPQLLEAAVTASLRSRGAMRLQDLVSVVRTCAELNHYSAPLFQEACTQFYQAVAEGALAQPAAAAQGRRQQEAGGGGGGDGDGGLTGLLTDLAWSCAIVHHLDAQLVQRLGGWTAQIDVAALSQAQLLQWFEVQSCLTDAASAAPHRDLRSQGIANRLLLASQGAWMALLRGQRLTRFHKEVHEALELAGRRCRLAVPLDGPLVVDVVLQAPRHSRRKVALQLEAPDMFAANPPHAALGPTCARWRALQARGWQVITLRYSDWQRLKTPQERSEYMWALREAAALSTPGLAPDVVRAARPAGDAGAQSLGQKLWHLLE